MIRITPFPFLPIQFSSNKPRQYIFPSSLSVVSWLWSLLSFLFAFLLLNFHKLRFLLILQIFPLVNLIPTCFTTIPTYIDSLQNFGRQSYSYSYRKDLVGITISMESNSGCDTFVLTLTLAYIIIAIVAVKLSIQRGLCQFGNYLRCQFKHDMKF